MNRPLVIEEMVRRGQMRLSEASVVMPIVIDDVVEYHDSLADKKASLSQNIGDISVRPPYTNTWLEAEIPGEGYTAISVLHGEKRAVFAAVIGMLEKQGVRLQQGPLATARTVLPREWDTRAFGGPNAVYLSFVFWRPGSAPRTVGGRITACDEQWHPLLKSGHTIRLHPNDPSPLDWAGFALLALAMFHIKNSEVVSFGNRTQRKANLRGPLGIVVKELVIAPLRRTLQAIREYRADHPGQPLPLHLRRGHFKTFTAERPLLGKHVGTYWWEPCWRGSEHMGVVVHDRAVVRVS